LPEAGISAARAEPVMIRLAVTTIPKIAVFISFSFGWCIKMLLATSD
jgi:hypothetical protein